MVPTSLSLSVYPITFMSKPQDHCLYNINRLGLYIKLFLKKKSQSMEQFASFSFSFFSLYNLILSTLSDLVGTECNISSKS